MAEQHTLEELEELVNDWLHCGLFHVMSDDKDENGVSIEELQVANFVASNPWVLTFKSLREWVDAYCGKCYAADIKRQNDEYMTKKIINIF
jgi:hypothetical protein